MNQQSMNQQSMNQSINKLNYKNNFQLLFYKASISPRVASMYELT